MMFKLDHGAATMTKPVMTQRRAHIPGAGFVKLLSLSIKRLVDVALLMISTWLCPGQAYRFSTRKMFQPKPARYPLWERPMIPFEMIPDRTSGMPGMEEIHIVMKGCSFDLGQINRLKGPVFLSGFSVRADVDRDVVYLQGDSRLARELTDSGLDVIFLETSTRDEQGNISVVEQYAEPLWYERAYRQRCKRISMIINVYRYHDPAYADWAPIGSGLAAIGALYPFADKINVYGWDFYLDSSPAGMSSWRLYTQLYKLRADLCRSRNHFESALINVYYGYHLSQSPKIRIHGHLGQLGKHKRLIDKIERALFNV